MASIILKSQSDKKGIIVFSHKELIFIQGRNYTYNHLLEKVMKRALVEVTGPLKRKNRSKILIALKEKYFIGVHWGWHATNIDTPTWVDFHLASPGTLETNDRIPIINLASTNFLPDCYLENVEVEKKYDVATICRDIQFKGIEYFIAATSELLNEKKIRNILLIVPEAIEQYGKKSGFAIREQINDNFDSDRLNQVHYLRLSAAGGYLGTNREFTSELIRQTKVFCLLSKKEGVAKVLNEAQLCGANIVANSGLVGGGLDFMDKDFFFPYKELREVSSSILRALNSPLRKNDNLKLLRSSLTQKSNYPKLISQLSSVLCYSFPSYDENLYLDNDLSKILPNHKWFPSVSWIEKKRGLYEATDIQTFRELKGFQDAAIC